MNVFPSSSVTSNPPDSRAAVSLSDHQKSRTATALSGVMNTNNVYATVDRQKSTAEDEKHLKDFFNSAEFDAHRAFEKEIKRSTIVGKLKDTFHRESIPDSVAALRKRDYPISKGQIFRAHKAPANSTGNVDVLRNNARGATDSVDDYIAHVIRHTASCGSAGSILSFSANKKVSKKFMGGTKYYWVLILTPCRRMSGRT
ncbi:hypothetical protein [Pseudomonas sp. TH31]|uniref:hypothetical protein n=1 Tax=Pseudomonas sp. TH31 TaxID=2796396 RepID=UPI0019141071|nr:hypothetical protein [Pseudomonas sp. TH31]MBK5414062.1 hypothetical protein [Pseudomonas sp. TH31]